MGASKTKSTNELYGRFEVKPAAYLEVWEAQSTATRPRVAVARQNRILAQPQPDSPSINITGKYQEEHGYYTFHINQAGKYIVCWYEQVLDATNETSAPESRVFYGELQDDGSFTRINPASDAKEAGLFTLTRFENVRGHLKWHRFQPGDKGRSAILVPRSFDPTLSQSALSVLPPGDDIYKLIEWDPLTSQEFAKLRKSFSSDAITPHLRKFFAYGTDKNAEPKSEKAKIAGRLNGDVEKVMDSFHPSHRRLAQFHARAMLAAWSWSYGGTERSGLEWLSVMAYITKSDGVLEDDFLRHLDIRERSPDATRHQYDITIDYGGFGGDVGIGVGLFRGKMYVVKDQNDEPMEFTFWMGSGAVGASIGFKVGGSESGTVYSHDDWQPRDFLGWFNMGGVGASLSSGWGISGGANGMIIGGDGSHEPLAVNFSGGSITFGAGAGVEVEGVIGWIKNLDSVPKELLRNKKAKEVYDIESRAGNNVHFRLGDATLTQEGWDLLRYFCAVELAGFMSEGSVLKIEGHTDRVDTELHNIELSELRARNVYQAIKDILGASFRIPDNSDQIQLYRYGEREAEIFGEKDDAKNHKFRRVDISLNGTLKLSLKGQ